MFVASYAKTMSGAKRVVEDRGIALRPLHRQSSIIGLSRMWNLAQEAKRREQAKKTEAQRIAIERAIERFSQQQPEPVEVDTKTTAKQLIQRVAAWHEGVTPQDILGKSRSHHIVAARFDAIVAVYLNCRIDGKRYTLPALGRCFGRDHTSVLNALRHRGIETASRETPRVD